MMAKPINLATMALTESLHTTLNKYLKPVVKHVLMLLSGVSYALFAFTVLSEWMPYSQGQSIQLFNLTFNIAGSLSYALAYTWFTYQVITQSATQPDDCCQPNSQEIQHAKNVTFFAQLTYTSATIWLLTTVMMAINQSHILSPAMTINLGLLSLTSMLYQLTHHKAMQGSTSMTTKPHIKQRINTYLRGILEGIQPSTVNIKKRLNHLISFAKQVLKAQLHFLNKAFNQPTIFLDKFNHVFLAQNRNSAFSYLYLKNKLLGILNDIHQQLLSIDSTSRLFLLLLHASFDAIIPCVGALHMVSTGIYSGLWIMAVALASGLLRVSAELPAVYGMAEIPDEPLFSRTKAANSIMVILGGFGLWSELNIHVSLAVSAYLGSNIALMISGSGAVMWSWVLYQSIGRCMHHKQPNPYVRTSMHVAACVHGMLAVIELSEALEIIPLLSLNTHALGLLMTLNFLSGMLVDGVFLTSNNTSLNKQYGLCTRFINGLYTQIWPSVKPYGPETVSKNTIYKTQAFPTTSNTVSNTPNTSRQKPAIKSDVSAFSDANNIEDIDKTGAIDMAMPCAPCDEDENYRTPKPVTRSKFTHPPWISCQVPECRRC
ncbi:MAG: hypothetical protein VXY77_04545 [Pseudomonadota bacterium]|nr:hypothetical protein [Pseudomonadota bacterium]